MNIDVLKGQFRDYARGNLFMVRFGRIPTPPEAAVAGGSIFDQIKAAATKVLKSFFDVPVAQQDTMIDFAVKTTKIPSIGMNAPELIWKGYKMPTVGTANLGEFDITFIIDHDRIIYNYFARWMNDILDMFSGDGTGMVNHKENLLTNIDIYQLKSDLNMENSYMISIINAYPITIGEIGLSEEEGFSEFTVTFNYTTIQNKNAEKEMIRDEEAGKSLLDKAKGFVGGLL